MQSSRFKYKTLESVGIMKMKRFASNRGFTLIELMVTVVAIGIVAAIVTPHFDIAIERAKFKAQNREIISELRTARSEAITKKAAYGLYFDSNSKIITMFADKVNLSSFKFDLGSDSIITSDTLPPIYSYLWATFSNLSIVFQPNGSASQSGDIYLMTDDGQYMNFGHLKVLASTGKSSIEYIHNY
jgi:type IV fimbrial biogenesis protein FimT